MTSSFWRHNIVDIYSRHPLSTSILVNCYVYCFDCNALNGMFREVDLFAKLEEEVFKTYLENSDGSKYIPKHEVRQDNPLD